MWIFTWLALAKRSLLKIEWVVWLGSFARSFIRDYVRCRWEFPSEYKAGVITVATVGANGQPSMLIAVNKVPTVDTAGFDYGDAADTSTGQGGACWLCGVDDDPV